MIITTNGMMMGKLDNIVVCNRRGGTYLRMAPIKVRQTGATKRSSSNFSIAAGKGRILRGSLLPVLHFPKDKRMQNAFQGAIQSWLCSSGMQPVSIANDISRLRNFKFNPHTEVSSRWKVAINVIQAGADEIVVQLPAFIPATEIVAPANTVNVECTIAAASVLMGKDKSAGSDHFSMLVPHDREVVPAQSISLAVHAKPGCLVVVAASMKYHLVNKKTDTRLSFLPSSVIGAWYVE